MCHFHSFPVFAQDAPQATTALMRRIRAQRETFEADCRSSHQPLHAHFIYLYIVFGDEVDVEIDSLQCNSWRSGCRMEQFQIPVSLSWIVFRSETDTLDLLFLGLTKSPHLLPRRKRCASQRFAWSSHCMEFRRLQVASLANIGT